MLLFNRLLKKLRDTGTVNRLPGSGRPRNAALNKMLIWLKINFTPHSQNGP